MAKRTKKKTAGSGDAPDPAQIETGLELDPSVALHEPTCAECGYEVPNDCASGAGCPECHTPIVEGEELETELEEN